LRLSTGSGSKVAAVSIVVSPNEPMLPILNRAGARSLVFPVAVRDLEKISGGAKTVVFRSERSELFPHPKTRCV